MTPLSILEKLKKHHNKFYERIISYIEIYGDRTLAELKLENPSLKDEPELFIKLLQSTQESKLTKKTFINNQIKIREAAELQLNKKLKLFNPRRYILNVIIKMASKGLQNRENMRFARARAYGAVKRIFKTIGNLMVQENFISVTDDVFYLSLDDVRHFCNKKKNRSRKEQIKILKNKYAEFLKLKLPNRIIYSGDKIPHFSSQNNLQESKYDEIKFSGIPVSTGYFKGESIVITEPDWSSDVKNKIIVTQMTDPGWVFLMLQASGLISEKGSLLSHTAIIGRELDIPVIVGVNKATSKIKTGDILIIDGNSGKIEIVNK